MSGRSSRTKGHNYERTIARIFRKLWPPAKRGLQTQSGGQAVPDVDGTPLWIEVKRYKAIRGLMAIWYRLLREAKRIPVLIVKEDRADPVVVISLAFFVGLVDSADDDLAAVEAKGKEIMDDGD